jgi:hypothetical protein
VITCAFALSVSMMALSPSTAQTPAGHKPDAQEASAQLAFDRLKTLAGHWKGRAMGPGLDAAVTVTLRVTSGGAAVMHEMVPEGRSEDPTNGDDDPITMLYLDSGRLTLTHYCDSGKNRPRMVGSLSADGKTLQFTLLDISGGTSAGHMHGAAFTIVDADHHTEERMYAPPGGQPLQAHIELVRAR